MTRTKATKNRTTKTDMTAVTSEGVKERFIGTPKRLRQIGP